ncbi:MAG: PEP-CTERM sorting domain-containing protein [Parvularculaceae bacterium]|nr:PEP-CTERM sorting domain-containing protein [Parvularculaceae bacterium]
MKSLLTTAAVAAIAFAGIANAAVSSGAFTPTATEDYEGTPGSRAVLTSLFGGDVAVVSGTVNHTSINEGDWIDFRTGEDIVPVSGIRFGTQFGDGSFSLDFSALGGVSGFSFWASAAGAGSDNVEFFDADDNSIGSFTDADGWGAAGVMEFFSYVSSAPIYKIVFTGQETAFDNLAYGAATAPVPVPAALPLFAAGLGLVASRRRRTK